MMQIAVVEEGDVIAVMKDGLLKFYILNTNMTGLEEVWPEAAATYQEMVNNRKGK